MRHFEFVLKPRSKPNEPPEPVIPIIITNPNNNKQSSFLGIVDTGADYITIPIDMQIPLGLDLKGMQAPTTRLNCACGKGNFTGYKFKLNVIIYDTEGKEFTELLTIVFMESKTNALIGRNFMEMFESIQYDNQKRKGFFINPKEDDD